MSKNRSTQSIILSLTLGALLGSLFIAYPGTIFVLLLTFVIGYFVWIKAEPGQRKLLIGLFAAGLLVRYIIIFYYYHFYLTTGAFPFLAPDGEVTVQRAWYISRALLGKNINLVPTQEYVMKYNWVAVDMFKGKLPHWNQYQIGIYTYFMGWFFSWFGYEPVAVKCINALSFVSACVINYYIAKEIFGKRVAGLTYLILLFLPSMFVHSLTNLLDPLLILYISLSLWSLVKIAKYLDLRYYLLLACSIACIFFLKKPIALIIISTSLVTIFWTVPIRLFRKLALVALLFAVISIPAIKGGVVEIKFSMARFIQGNRSYSSMARNTYRLYPERFYQVEPEVPEDLKPKEFFQALAKGSVYFLFSPFPFDETLQSFGLLSGLQNIFWYAMFPLSIIGLIVGMRYKNNEMIPLFVTVLAFTFILSLSEGNTATAFRHRDFIMPIFIMCAVAGFMVTFRKNLMFKHFFKAKE